MQTRINQATIDEIVEDINYGEFTGAGYTTTREYDGGIVEVSIGVDGDLYLKRLDVVIYSDDEEEIDDEQYRMLCDEMREALRYAREDAGSEYRFERYLWRACV